MEKTNRKKHGVLWWLFIGWYWMPIKLIYFIIPVAIYKKIKSLIKHEDISKPFSAKQRHVFKPANIDTSAYKKKFEPTEKQLNYAKDLGIVITDDMSRKDVSTLISRIEDDDYSEPSVDLLLYAQSLGEEPSPYETSAGAVATTIWHMSDIELCSFYAYAVFCSVKNIPLGDPRKSEKSESFKVIGEALSQNEKALKSVKNISCNGFLNLSKKTIAYTETIGLLVTN